MCHFSNLSPCPTGHFTVKGVVPTATGDPSKLKVKARLNIHGIFSVVTATLYEKLAEPAEAEGNGKEKEAEGMEDQAGEKAPEDKEKPCGAGGEDADTPRTEEPHVDRATSMEAEGKEETAAAKEEGGESGPQQEQAAAGDGETQSSQDPPAKNGGDNAGDKNAAAKKKKKTVKAIDLAVSACTASASREQLDRAREEEVGVVYCSLSTGLHTSFSSPNLPTPLTSHISCIHHLPTLPTPFSTLTTPLPLSHYTTVQDAGPRSSGGRQSHCKECSGGVRV